MQLQKTSFEVSSIVYIFVFAREGGVKGNTPNWTSFPKDARTRNLYQACDLLVEVHHIASDLIILLSVHPTWGEDEVELPYEYDGDARRKIRITPC